MADFLRQSLLEFQAPPPLIVIVRLVVAFALGLVVAMVYRRTRPGHVVVASFSATLVMLCILIVYFIFKPLSVIKKATMAIAEGKFNKLEVINTRDEIQQVMEAFNIMVSELERRQDQLIQAEKLSSLGTLTAGVAHQLNNPLNNIGLFVGNAIDHLDLGVADKEPVRRELQQALQQVRKATEIISHLRTFGRAARVSREPVPINQVIGRALALMQEQLRLRQITVVRDLSPEDPLVLGNAIQLEQVFLNLLTNARDAMAESPRVR